MKTKKFLVAGIMLLVMILLAGCGTEEKKDESKNENQQESVKSTYSNLGNYAEYEGNVYYWKLTPECRDGAALFAKYGPVIGAKVELTRLEPDGNEFPILKDTGNGNIYITNDTIFFQLNENGTYKVYSVDLEGNNKKSYVNGEIKYANGDYLYIQNNTDIAVLNTKTGAVDLTIDKADLIGMAGENAYYISGDAGKEISVGYIKGSTNNTNVATFNTSEYKETDKSNANITLYDYSFENNKVQIKVGDVQGTGHFIQEGWIIEMDADGQNVTKKEDASQTEESSTLLGITDLPVSYNTEKGLVYKDPDNGSEKVILDNEKIKSEFGFKVYKDDEEAFVEVYSADKVGDSLYIVIDNGIHYPAGDIGWRYSYKRVKTAAFKYDLGSGEIEKLYEF